MKTFSDFMHKNYLTRVITYHGQSLIGNNIFLFPLIEEEGYYWIHELLYIPHRQSKKRTRKNRYINFGSRSISIVDSNRITTLLKF